MREGERLGNPVRSSLSKHSSRRSKTHIGPGLRRPLPSLPPSMSFLTHFAFNEIASDVLSTRAATVARPSPAVVVLVTYESWTLPGIKEEIPAIWSPSQQIAGFSPKDDDDLYVAFVNVLVDSHYLTYEFLQHSRVDDDNSGKCPGREPGKN